MAVTKSLSGAPSVLKNADKALPDCPFCTVLPLTRPKEISVTLPYAEFRLTPVSQQRLKLAARHNLFYEGQPAYQAFYLHRGFIKRYLTLPSGEVYLIKLHQAGDTLGLADLIQGYHGSTAQTLEPCTVCVIEKTSINGFLQAHSEKSAWLFRQLAREIEELTRKAASLAYKSVPARIAETLLMLKDACGVKDPSGHTALQLQFTREMLAQLAGTVVETTVRCLSRFKTQKYIEIQQRRIYILNENVLRELAEQG